MHPVISKYPSYAFYSGCFFDGPHMAALRAQPWHKSALLGPYRFFDVAGTQTRGDGSRSLVNHSEVLAAAKLYRHFRAASGGTFDGKMGIITPYKAQLFALRSHFGNAFGVDEADTIEFNTTDAFQGRECDIIIFSCVRANATGGIGFMNDFRRMNVGLTRAKSSLWILGDATALSQGRFWKDLLADARKRRVCMDGHLLDAPPEETSGADTAT